MKKDKKIFILISALVFVVLILGVFLPVFCGKKERSHDWDYKWCKNHLKQLGIALSAYKLDYNTYPESLSNLYPEYVKLICLNIDVENKRKNCFMCPAQTSFTREPANVDSWTTYIYRKPPDNLKEDFMIIHCLGYPHFRQRCELWLNKEDEFETKMSKYVPQQKKQ